MILDLSGWTKRFNQLDPTLIPIEGVTNFAQAVADLTNPLQANPGGVPGILTFAQPVFVANLSSLAPTLAASWVAILANAWNLAMAASIITPGTVTNAVWLGSGGVDSSTAGTGTAVIQNLAAATAQLSTELATITPDVSAQGMALAFRDATLMLQLQVIGLAPPLALTPIPIVVGIE